MKENHTKYLKLTKKYLKNSYSPYSGFQVACMITLKDSRKKFFGVNIENSSFGVTQCAERVCLSNLISKGLDSKKDIKNVYVVTSLSKQIKPCGMCLQFMAELLKPETPIITCGKKVGDYKVYTIKELLPHAFFL